MATLHVLNLNFFLVDAVAIAAAAANVLSCRNFPFIILDGHSPTNLANSSTSWKFPFLANSSTHQNGLFWKCVELARFADICQHGLLGLTRLADIRQPGLLGLARLAKGNFGKFYANLENLASLANLASVG